ncbi:MAG: hypothetical protein ACO1QR_08190 [Chthoniobacteraceae bacterium]
MKLLSTAEYMKQHKIDAWGPPRLEGAPDLREGVDCQGVVMRFTVDDRTPSLLDLGELVNPPTEAMKGKAGPPEYFGAALP